MLSHQQQNRIINSAFEELEDEIGIFGCIRLISDINNGLNTHVIQAKYNLGKYTINQLRKDPSLSLSYVLGFHNKLRLLALCELKNSKIKQGNFSASAEVIKIKAVQ
jgi:hypothetical protein